MPILVTFGFIAVITLCGYATGSHTLGFKIVDLIAAILEIFAIVSYSIYILPFYPGIWSVAILWIAAFLILIIGAWIGHNVFELQAKVDEANQSPEAK